MVDDALEDYEDFFGSPHAIYIRALSAKGRGEPIELTDREIDFLKRDPKWAYRYAVNVIGGRWPEAEPYIARHIDLAYSYAVNIIKGRWPEAEGYMSGAVPVPEDAPYFGGPRGPGPYAQSVWRRYKRKFRIRGRWPNLYQA